ncbi:15-hydroxyprostaglandin dehydrogenase [NAD(+)]-like isoform X2 [Babylonia areolata]|uniref:15-hydroxyprostaglandin dehydrogenase [NAD(+)]-like isoform X1 n=1 Tax=Babylonia areolata TaxID=304850 RepID=UPI003FD0E77A
MDLSGRGVFLTGGAQGIGRCIAAALLGKGARVLFCDVNPDVGKATEEELQKQYGADNVAFVQCDVTNADQLKAAFDAAVSKFGAVEICANNAGIMNEKIWEKMIAINTTAQIRGSQLAFEHMRRDKGGRGGVIVNTVSVAGLNRHYWLPVYVASKHAMIGYTTSCAADPDIVAQGVRWCCLCPVPVNTALLDFKGGEVKNDQELTKIMEPLKIQPEDVATAFLKLVQDVDNNGKILVAGRQAMYRQRMLVDEDGASNPVVVDTPLTQHPSVPGQ